MQRFAGEQLREQTPGPSLALSSSQSPVGQSELTVQDVPVPSVGSAWQPLSWQVSPAAQGELSGQHGWPSAPQVIKPLPPVPIEPPPATPPVPIEPPPATPPAPFDPPPAGPPAIPVEPPPAPVEPPFVVAPPAPDVEAPVPLEQASAKAVRTVQRAARLIEDNLAGRGGAGQTP